jgi:hypothetical protein
VGGVAGLSSLLATRALAVGSLQLLAEEDQGFDPQATWRSLAADDNLYELLYMLRLLWTAAGIYKETT